MSTEYWNKKNTHSYSKTDWAHKPSIFAELAVKTFPKTGKVLEIGTGQGGDANFFQTLGYMVTATDYSDEAIASNKSRIKNVNFAILDTSKGLPFEDATFDAIYSHMALHYFDKKTTEKVFSEIHRVLKPNGVFATILNTIDDPEIKEFNYTEIEPYFYHDPKSINKRYFSVDSMKDFAENLFDVKMLDDKGETYKDEIKNLIRFIGVKK